MQRRLFIVGIGVAALTMAGVATPSFAQQEPIKIGVTGPFTGGSAAMGVSMRDGVRLAVDEVNKAGGVLGRPLLLVERDDEARNELGVQLAQELINRERVVATLGYINTGVALASQRFFQEARIPVITNVATGTQITRQFSKPEQRNNYIFRISAPDNVQAPMIVEEAIKRRGYKKVAIFADSTNYGQLGRQDLEAALGKAGVKPVAVETFNIGDVDMTSQLLRAKQADADAILTYGIGPELAQIANGMSRLGWKVPLVGSWTLSMASFIDTAGPNGDGARMPQTFIQEPTTPRRKAFIDAYQKSFGGDRMPSPVSAAQGYDSVLLLTAAIKQAGTTDGPRVRAALEDLRDVVEGVVTNYRKPFTEDDHEAVTQNIPVFGEVVGGRVRFANPEDLQNAGTLRLKQTTN